jgi:hypothetical protein
VNGDNKPDLICANFDDNTLSVLTNNGDGTFTAASTNAVGRFPDYVAAADLNGDGKIELISANWGADSLTVLTNNGFSVFGSNATYSVGSFPVSLAVADVNGDHKLDLISADNGDDTLTVLTNNGNGTFNLASTIVTGDPNVDFGPQSITAADINGDGKVDLIFVDFSDYSTPGILTVLTNNGTGEFTNFTTFAVGEGPYWVVTVDVNEDGKLDLVTANHEDNTLSVLIHVPKLSINTLLNAVNVSWRSSWTNWTLQQNSDLATTNWLPSANILDDGTNKNLLIQSSLGKLFFRLSHQ